MGNKKALVIGAGGGIGKAIVKQLTIDGFDVFAGTRDMRAVEGSSQEVFVDVSKVETLERVFSSICFDVIVLSVTDRITHASLWDKEWDDYEKHLNTQVKGLWNVVSSLKKQIFNKYQTKIIIISTHYCFGTPPKQISDYITSKYALVGLMKAVAVELARYGSTINAVAPGMTKTELLDFLPEKLLEITADNNPLKRLGEPQDIANTVSFLASDKSSYINGQNIIVDGGVVMD